MCHWFVELGNKLNIDSLITDSALRLFLFAHKSTNPNVIRDYDLSTVQGMWLFCSLVMIFKVIHGGYPTQLEILLVIKNRYYKKFSQQWAKMEHHLLQVIDYRVVDFIYKVQLFDAHGVGDFIGDKEWNG